MDILQDFKLEFDDIAADQTDCTFGVCGCTVNDPEVCTSKTCDCD